MNHGPSDRDSRLPQDLTLVPGDALRYSGASSIGVGLGQSFCSEKPLPARVDHENFQLLREIFHSHTDVVAR